MGSNNKIREKMQVEASRNKMNKDLLVDCCLVIAVKIYISDNIGIEWQTKRAMS